jgi:pimeloyl-ACP methyl ester carboxylesterase
MSDRPTFVMLPGLLCDKTVFAHQAEHLADLADIQIPSMFGYDTLLDMARGILEEAPPTFALLGFSMGGRVALQIMRLAPERVSHLVLMDTGAHPGKPSETKDRERLIETAHARGMRLVADAWLPGMLYPDHQTKPAIRGPLTDMVCRATPAAYERQLRALMSRPDARPILPTIACPTLVICGRQDLWSTLAQHEEIAAAIPGAELAVIEDSGHFASFEQPEAFTRRLRAWLLKHGFAEGVTKGAAA